MPHSKRNVKFLILVFIPLVAFFLGLFSGTHYWEGQTNDSSSQEEVSKKESSNSPLFSSEEKKELIEKTKEEEDDELEIWSLSKEDNNLTSPKDMDMTEFWGVWNALEEAYLESDNLDKEAMMYGAIKGMVSSLEDPYTVYLDPKEMADFEEMMSGEFEGIGAQVTIKEGYLTIVAPLKGSPAEAAGIMANDVVYEIEGEPTFGDSIEESITKIKGPKGEPVELGILREGENEPLSINVVRDVILLHDIEWEMKDGVAHIEISQFGETTARDFSKALDEILLKSPSAVVLDLRNNGGGMVSTLTDMMGHIVPDQVVLKTQGKSESEEYRASAFGKKLEGINFAVLINGGSASASEIFAGVVQDYEKGVVVGSTSFGKGTMQSLVHQIPGNAGGQLKVTIAEWMTPGGRSINKNGVEPDFYIKDSDLYDENDEVLAKAIDILADEELMASLIAKTDEELMLEAKERDESIDNILAPEEEESTSRP